MHQQRLPGAGRSCRMRAVLDTLRDAERFHRRLLSACVRADARAAQGSPRRVHRDHRRRRDRCRTRGRNPPYDRRACRVWPRASRRAPRHPAHDARSRAANPAAAIRTRCGGRHRIAAAARRRGVRQRTGDGGHADKASPRSPATCYPADLVVWAAGIKAPDWLASLDGLEVNRNNQLVVTETLQSTRDPDIFAFGDCAAAPWQDAPVAGAWCRRVHRLRASRPRCWCKTIGARLDGKPLPIFRFRDFGSLVSLGELSAVGNLMGRLIGGNLLIQGMIARWMYVVALQNAPGIDPRRVARRIRHAGAEFARRRRAARETPLTSGAAALRPRHEDRLPDRHALLRGTVQLVARLELVGLVERIEIGQRAVHAELVRRMRVGLDDGRSGFRRASCRAAPCA